MARSITDPYWQARALADLAGVLAQTGRREQALPVADRAEAAARSITDPDYQALALAIVAWALAWAGQREQAAEIAAQAETAARSIAHPADQAQVLAAVARALAQAAARAGGPGRRRGRDRGSLYYPPARPGVGVDARSGGAGHGRLSGPGEAACRAGAQAGIRCAGNVDHPFVVVGLAAALGAPGRR